MLYPITRSLMFRLEPERAHTLALKAIAQAGAIPPLRAALAAQYSVQDAEPVEAFGIRFPNRVGLAAGYDKDGEGWRGLSALGFGHIEVGTVTPEPQPGNPRPRVFRLPEKRSLVNRMGFPGQGAQRVAKRLGGSRPGDVVIGVNIGKQKSTPLENAVDDYTVLMDVFAPLADYLAINISSPNTPGLRQLQERHFLSGLLGGAAARKVLLEQDLGRRVPVLVKTAVDVIVESGLDGIIATNTTIGRVGVDDHPASTEAGGLSGAALSELSTEILAAIVQHLGGALPVIGVGGVMGPKEAREKLDAGAILVQVFTGLIYAGPGLAKEILGHIDA